MNGVATISSPDARTLVIQPWDGKLLKDIQKAIQVSDLGINPQNDGRVIRLVFPQLTEERRKDLTKQVKKYGEEAKVALRNIRRDGMDYVKKLKKNSEITEAGKPWFFRSTMVSSANRELRYRVEETWQMPPPTSSTSSVPE